MADRLIEDRKDEDVSMSAGIAPATDEHDPAQWVWGDKDVEPRFLHTMIRVVAFETALRFYIGGLGMKVLHRFSVPVRRVDAMFVGYAGYAQGGMLELVRLWDHEGPHSHGSGYGHISIGVPDVEAMVARLEGMGAEVVTPPAVLIPGGPVVAFVTDFDGYAIELIQTCRK